VGGNAKSCVISHMLKSIKCYLVRRRSLEMLNKRVKIILTKHVLC